MRPLCSREKKVGRKAHPVDEQQRPEQAPNEHKPYKQPSYWLPKKMP